MDPEPRDSQQSSHLPLPPSSPLSPVHPPPAVLDRGVDVSVIEFAGTDSVPFFSAVGESGELNALEPSRGERGTAIVMPVRREARHWDCASG